MGTKELSENEKYQRLKTIASSLLEIIDEDPRRDGLRDTPDRFARMWLDFINFDAGKMETTFESVQTDQMIVVRGMRVWSYCEHHIVPFWCDISIGYICKDRILGLSKFGRIAQHYAHRLQVQERLVHQIAEHLKNLLGDNVIVFAEGEHLCMTSRGVSMPARMMSSSASGVFLIDHAARAEFFAMLNKNMN